MMLKSDKNPCVQTTMLCFWLRCCRTNNVPWCTLNTVPVSTSLNLAQWCNGSNVDLQSSGIEFWFSTISVHVMTLRKLFTLTCLAHLKLSQYCAAQISVFNLFLRLSWVIKPILLNQISTMQLWLQVLLVMTTPRSKLTPAKYLTRSALGLIMLQVTCQARPQYSLAVLMQ